MIAPIEGEGGGGFQAVLDPVLTGIVFSWKDLFGFEGALKKSELFIPQQSLIFYPFAFITKCNFFH